MQGLRKAAVTLLVLALGACSPDETQPPSGPDSPSRAAPRELTADHDRMVRAANDFAFALLGRAAATTDEANLVLSPLSASIALGMLLNGATGDTRAEIEQALRLQGLDTRAINAGYRDLSAWLVAQDEDVEVTTANALFARRGIPFEPLFMDTVASYFDAAIRTLDFADPASIDVMNGWVSDQTNGRIDEIISEIDSTAIMFLMNAIYFRGDWTRAFDPERTANAPFTRADGSTVEVPMMSMDEGKHSFAMLEDGTTLIDLAYGRGAWSMTVVLPPQGTDAMRLAASLDRARWDAIVARLDTVDRVMVRMPRFTLEDERTLNEDLQALGMRRAFTDDAQLTALTPMPAFVYEVKQKAFIAVDEVGTEAAAVTSIEVRAVSMPPHIFLDRPFLFAIRERRSGALLFVGVVGDPS